MDGLIFPLIAFVLAVVLIPIAIRLAPVLKLVDVPDERKQHEGLVPLIGGLIIFPVFVVCSYFTGVPLAEIWPLYAGIALLLATGAADDKFHIHPWVKFFMQACAAALLVFPGNTVIYTLGDLFSLGTFELGFMAIPFSFAAVMLLINAVNLMDGLDGLASGYSAVALIWIAFVLYASGQTQEFVLVAILIASIAGFLVYNMRTPFRKKASLFLGDAGSLCLGLSLAWFSIHVGRAHYVEMMQPISIAWVLALPIMDTCAQFYRRAREGRHPFSPDRGHFHHHFVHAGVSDGRAVAIILSLAFITGAYGVLSLQFGMPQVVITVEWIVLILFHMWFSADPKRYIGLFSRLFTRSG
jgi:UDP-GlcNAc:undecaprenyl-phosphate GlcNAc-1-phosphate transferase